eukprot:scaffold69736_cov27-Attheya_sp.AAC.1
MSLRVTIHLNQVSQLLTEVRSEYPAHACTPDQATMDSVDSFADLDLSAEAPTSGVMPRSGLRPPSPGTSPLFSTPSSAMSGSTGGIGGLVTPILCGAMADWCGGAIGGSKGGRFCCKEAAKCTIQSHRTQKVALAAYCIYKVPAWDRHGQLKDEFLGEQMDSNLSSPGSWTPVDLVDVEVMEEAR